MTSVRWTIPIQEAATHLAVAAQRMFVEKVVPFLKFLGRTLIGKAFEPTRSGASCSS